MVTASTGATFRRFVNWAARPVATQNAALGSYFPAGIKSLYLSRIISISPLRRREIFVTGGRDG